MRFCMILRVFVRFGLFLCSRGDLTTLCFARCAVLCFAVPTQHDDMSRFFGFGCEIALDCGSSIGCTAKGMTCPACLVQPRQEPQSKPTSQPKPKTRDVSSLCVPLCFCVCFVCLCAFLCGFAWFFMFSRVFGCFCALGAILGARGALLGILGCTCARGRWCTARRRYYFWVYCHLITAWW